ncbi:unnamed protein product, partial [Prorocentrum cordatum]
MRTSAVRASGRIGSTHIAGVESELGRPNRYQVGPIDCDVGPGLSTAAAKLVGSSLEARRRGLAPGVAGRGGRHAGSAIGAPTC